MNIGLKRFVLGLSAFLVGVHPIPAEPPQAGDSSALREGSLVTTQDRGFYPAVPAYLYSRFSAVGIQGGYEYRKINLRLDFSVVEEFVGDQSQGYVIH